MKKTGLSIVILVGCFSIVVWLNAAVHDVRSKQISAEMSDIGRVPASVLVASSLEFKGAMANMMFLNASNFIGRKLMEQSKTLPEEWHQFYLLLDRITTLDGSFLDPYVFAEMMLAWQAQMYDEANMLLEKGIKARPDDWRLPYYIGFNHFFFKKDFVQGANYIKQAAAIDGSPPYFPNLASRLAFYGSRSKTALLFLEEMLVQNKQIKMSSELEKRLVALQGAAQLEDAAFLFMQQQGRKATSIDELVQNGFVESIPTEPYGGQWRLHPNGRVDSSSNFITVEK
ncbi:hypothetical protein SAMN05660420_02704 [Desulfuromusa kysingii]|uniref:Tetratricopeptide repeat-containing protein n=1 Tax=Desulfuromusa kysingii TaxID=37625 RepID=A0A1H4CX58_9BACT|nr:hypothetical protein [Desulfuromusa kysingii]SEA64816.1 hypothetical protein SAMN05660420_02704 [Desulfuromusa kysingii]